MICCPAKMPSDARKQQSAEDGAARDVSRLIAAEEDAVARALALLGERWTFLILRQAFFGVRRFGELLRNLGISKTVLTQRLNFLVESGLLERRRYHVDPDWYEYRLTEKGEALYPAILAVTQWADEHLASPDGPALVLRHERCGHDISPVRMNCGHCGEPVTIREIRPEPGPGATAALQAAAEADGRK